MGKEAEGPLEAAGSPVEERRALQSLLERYGLTLRGLDPRGETLFTDQGPYQVRRFSGSRDELVFVAAILSYLEERGFTALRRLCLTSDGQPGVSLGNGLYYLVAGEAGRRLELESRGRLGQAAALLAGFHAAGEGFPGEVPGERIRYLRWPEVLQERQDDLQAMRREAVHSRGEFARTFLEYADDFLEQGERALTGLLAAPLAELQRECAERRRLVYRRFTPRKVRRVGQELLLDGWAHLALDFPVVDLATFVTKACGNDPDRAWTFVEAYHDLRPLGEAEWEVFVAWLRFPHQFWRLGHQHFHRRETHRSRLAKVIRQEVEREVSVETLALRWASEKLAPALPTPDRLPPAGEPTSPEEREATVVSEPEELIGLGKMEIGMKTGMELETPEVPVVETVAEAVEEPAAEAVPAPEVAPVPEQSPEEWSEVLVLSEVPPNVSPEVLELSSLSDGLEVPVGSLELPAGSLELPAGSPELPVGSLEALDTPDKTSPTLSSDSGVAAPEGAAESTAESLLEAPAEALEVDFPSDGLEPEAAAETPTEVAEAMKEPSPAPSRPAPQILVWRAFPPPLAPR